jgi:hypothetical protein
VRTFNTVPLAPVCLAFALAAATSLHAQMMRLPTPTSKAPNDHMTTDNLLPRNTSNGGKTSTLSCSILPMRQSCGVKAGYTDQKDYVNAFYRTFTSISFFNQVKSIYNAASASATLSADLTSLNFTDGMQVNVATNVQAGSTGSTAISSGDIPTLSAAASGQAAQNMLYGGTMVVTALYPFIAIDAAKANSTGAFGLTVDTAVREGIDIQNFKSGVNTSVTSPPSHASALLEGYAWYNSTNLNPDSGTFAGALFVGGSYGYSHTSHEYARDYGFGPHLNRPIGQISAGILINNVAKISVSRGFGPSQTYVDSASMLPKTVNNFKSWSIGVTYQSTGKNPETADTPTPPSH